ncbi:amino acid ABC transporter permease [Desertimonas flava]|uniref:amino acid ABC transporter permease n=1 Tax=Desertimonas flava TaxID=2064846 RepID=UPI000E34AF21|nr:amino acid ABC transporter permease [Desertimonas flava]
MDPLTADITVITPPEPPRPSTDGPGDWLRRNLFRSVGDTIVTIVSAVVVGYLVYRLGRFVLVTGRWEIVRRNLSLFMYGRFPRDELWRLVVSLAWIGAYVGAFAGLIERRREAAGLWDGPIPLPDRIRSIVQRLWPLLAGTLLLLLLARTALPWLAMLAVFGAAVVGRLVGSILPPKSLLAVLVVGVASVVGIMVLLLDAAPWDEWGGFMVNIFLAAVAITLCFPLGVLLALGRQAGRRIDSTTSGIVVAILLAIVPVTFLVLLGFDASRPITWILVIATIAVAAAGFLVGRTTSLPLVRVLSVAYIEFFRGVPLYVLLFLSYLALGFFLPRGSSTPSLMVRAVVVFTLFTAAYIAEIVRGGLQSLPRGQTEAAQALGLGPLRTNALIVLPQALRNVIPGIVGQFISLFKDTTLAAAVMGILDPLQVSDVANQQDDFVGQRLSAETISFVMLLFWIGCITLSRESQRLERRLGVGTR